MMAMHKLLQTGVQWLDQTSDRVIRGMVVGTIAILLCWGLVLLWHHAEYVAGNWNRTPPIKVTPIGDPPIVKPGQIATVQVQTEFDLGRPDCAQTARRLVIDSKLIAHYMTTEAISKEARSDIVETEWSSTRRDVAFVVPANISPGGAFYEVRLQFVCNKHQRKNPIPYTWRAPFIVVK
jgi:hypothetical protein